MGRGYRSGYRGGYRGGYGAGGGIWGLVLGLLRVIGASPFVGLYLMITGKSTWIKVLGGIIMVGGIAILCSLNGSHY